MNNNNDFENEKEILDIEQENTEEPQKKSAGREFLEWLQAIVIAVVVASVVRNFIFTVVKVDGQSMMPTLNDSDRMIVWQLGYDPEQGDIVVFNPPGYSDDVYWIKRVIATEGQTVKIDYAANSVYVDGEKIDEPYLGEPMRDPQNSTWLTEAEVPEGCVFVMGDNRNNSDDGRDIGPISEERIVGEAVLRFWPLNSIKTY